MHHLAGYLGRNYNYLICGHFPNINMSNQGTSKQLINTSDMVIFPKLNISYRCGPLLSLTKLRYIQSYTYYIWAQNHVITGEN